MIFHTGNYARSHYNFSIEGLSGTPNFSAIASTLYNIHFRGSPTLPSRYLKQKLLAEGIEAAKHPSIHIDDSYVPNWQSSILGNDSGFNPALDFYETLLPVLLGKFKFLHSLFRPETLISDIIGLDASKDFVEERVDFFLPVANLVIEIDGSQHQEQVSIYKDKARDRVLRKHSILSLRLTTSELNDEEALNDFLHKLQEHLTSNKILQLYEKFIKNDTSHSNLVHSTIYRLQAILIEMLGRNLLSLNDKSWVFWVSSEVEEAYHEIAVQDLLNWVSVIDKNQNIPEVILDKSQALYTIDLSVSRRWDDAPLENFKIRCRTDHFDYFPEMQVKGVTGKDYYSPCYSLAKLKLDITNLNFLGLLKEIFGYDRFNGGQIDIIENVLRGEDTIGILPTGGGKSLCYQFPSILSASVTLVVCPIKSLMRDQVQELVQIGFHRSASIDSDTTTSEKNRIIEKVEAGQIRFLFISPERLQIKKFRETIRSLNSQNLISLAVIDEVHCMSEWGHDFRISYLTLSNTLNRVMPTATRLCLTATASDKILKDIQYEFDIDRVNVKTLAIYERKNLHFTVIECEPFKHIHDVLDQKIKKNEIDDQHAGIVFTPYVNGAKGAYQLRDDIKAYLPKVNYFTGGMPKTLKKQNVDPKEFEKNKIAIQQDFKSNGFSVLIATKAFGMGVNKKNIYTTAHTGLPQSVEALYQEAGRAGRDQTDSDCFILFQPPSKSAFERFFNYGDFKRFTQLKFNADGGDLSTHHFFLKNNIQDNFEVLPVIEKILKAFSDIEHQHMEVIVSSDLKSNPDVVQLALYRLYQMGVVIDWTVDDFKKGIYTVEYSIKSVKYHEMVVKKLTKTDKNPDGIGLNTKDGEGDFQDVINCLTRLTKIVVEHHLDTRIHSRIESLKTLLIACDRFETKAPEKFRENIESFFTIDTINDSLSDVVSSNGRYETIIGYLSGSGASLLQLPSHKIEARLFPLRRYIESYPTDVSLSMINEMFLFHLNNVEPDKLVEKFHVYKEGMADIGDHIIFLKELSALFDRLKWNKFISYLIEDTQDTKELDMIAKELDEEIITQAIIKRIQPKLSTMSRELYELV